MIDDAYATFRHPAVTPLAQIGANLFVLELFHGPTLAFKDVAMQLLGRMMDHALKARGQRATIVGATSGDTGAAAIEAFRGLPQVDIFILYPHGRVSDVQRRQMTTVADANVHTIALEGTFDDCQAHREGAVQPSAFRDEVGCPASTRSTGPASSPRSSIISSAARRSAARTGPCPSRCRPAISATSSPAISPSAWACRSSGW